MVNGHLISFSVFLGTRVCPDGLTIRWQVSFVKLSAGCCLVILWSQGVLGAGAPPAGSCLPSPSGQHRGGSLLGSKPRWVALGRPLLRDPDKLFQYMGGVPILNVAKLEGFCFLLDGKLPEIFKSLLLQNPGTHHSPEEVEWGHLAMTPVMSHSQEAECRGRLPGPPCSLVGRVGARVHQDQPGLKGLSVPGWGVSPSFSRGVDTTECVSEKGHRGWRVRAAFSHLSFLPCRPRGAHSARVTTGQRSFHVQGILLFSSLFCSLCFSENAVCNPLHRFPVSPRGSEQSGVGVRQPEAGPRQRLLSLPPGEATWVQVVAEGGSVGKTGSS